MISMYDKASDISNNYFKYLMNLENVNGVGVGHKHINNIDNKEPCIHVFVEKKLQDSYLSKNNIIPKTYMGIKTDVIEVGVLKELGLKYDPFMKIRPLEGGYLISAGDTVGTLGCIVSRSSDFGESGDEDISDKYYYILSNNHVLTNNETLPIGTPIYQPADPNYPKEYIVARLSTYIPLKPMINDLGPVNFMDCALAKISNTSHVSTKIGGLGKINGVADPVLGSFIEKAGAFSAVTFGSVLSLSVTQTVQKNNGQLLLYKNQAMAFLKAESGDSGSCILDDNENIVGLGFAAGQSDQGLDVLVFTPIKNVLFSLGVNVYF